MNSRQVLCCWLITAIFCIAFMLGHWAGSSQERQNAVKHNVCYWDVDNRTGQLIFVYGSK